MNTANRLAKLNQTLAHCIASVDFYKRTLRKVLPRGAVETLDELRALPFTTKEDVQRHYPWGFAGAPPADLRLYSESSGTSGGDANRSSRVASFSTAGDVRADILRRTAGDLKFEPSDVVFNALPYAYTSSGILFHLAAMEAGAMVVPADNGSRLSSFRKQLDVIRRLKPTVIVTSYPFVYSTLLRMFRVPLEELSSLRAIQLCGMASSRAARKKISELFGGVPVFDTYGMSEFGAITATCKHGEAHVHEDFHVEIVNPKTLEPASEEEGGEVVITTLNREGSPKIRYRTGDVGRLSTRPCDCGRATPRLDVLGRLKDLLEIGGRRYMLSDFEAVIYAHRNTTGMYRPEFLETGAIRFTIDASEDLARTAADLRAAFAHAFSLDFELECVDVGQARRALLVQTEEGSIKSLQSIEGANARNQEWLVTY